MHRFRCARRVQYVWGYNVFGFRITERVCALCATFTHKVALYLLQIDRLESYRSQSPLATLRDSPPRRIVVFSRPFARLCLSTTVCAHCRSLYAYPGVRSHFLLWTEHAQSLRVWRVAYSNTQYHVEYPSCRRMLKRCGSRSGGDGTEQIK